MLDCRQMRIEAWPWFDATVAYLALLGGVLLVYWECARPGSYLPGAAGGALVLVALARWSTLPVTSIGVVLACVAIVLWIGELWLRWPGPPGIAGAVAMTLGAMRIIQRDSVPWWIALPAALVVGAATVILGSAAVRGFLTKRAV